MANEQQCSNASSCGRSSCEGCPSASGEQQQPTDFSAKLNDMSSVKKVIAIVIAMTKKVLLIFFINFFIVLYLDIINISIPLSFNF